MTLFVERALITNVEEFTYVAMTEAVTCISMLDNFTAFVTINFSFGRVVIWKVVEHFHLVAFVTLNELRSVVIKRITWSNLFT